MYKSVCVCVCACVCIIHHELQFTAQMIGSFQRFLVEIGVGHVSLLGYGCVIRFVMMTEMK